MSISVVIPCYNEEKFIEPCLNALKNQDEPTDEIIVVDNNCTDKTVPIAKKMGVRIITEKKQGIIPARDAGFNAAKSEIIGRIDADSVVPKYWIKRIKEDFKNRKIEAVTGPVFSYDLPFRSTIYANIYFTIMRIFQKGKETLLGPNMALSKKIWLKIRDEVCQDENKVHEDADLAIHIFLNGEKVFLDQNLVVGISGRRMKYNPLSFFFEYPTRAVKTLKVHSL